MMARAALLPVALLMYLALAGSVNAARKSTAGFYELKNRKGDFSIKVTNWGAALVSAIVPDGKGNLADVVLGYDTVAEYANGSASFGATVGRVANRIANAHFVLDGKTYHLLRNDGNNTIHGGPKGFGKVIWTVKEHVSHGDSPYITFYYHSLDGEQGFPGALDVYVKYQLSRPYDLSIRMNVTARNKATPVNLANHAYWNLAGHGSGDVLKHELQMFASHYTPVDASMIPTGQVASVAGTMYDFGRRIPVGTNMKIVPGGGGGYDMNYAVDGQHGQQNAMRPVARVLEPKSGRAFELWANQPGVQFYTASWLINEKGKAGKVYGQYGALCLETQAYPDAVNHPNFPSSIVRPGQVYKHDMVFRFSYQATYDA
ncbi:galactose mutarotase-like [Triticum urartu]|uniref:Aldose 1-epimerase n=1 Tax=Triticum urartu TaxID=4572 RepID=A0A8R7PGE0_TRIUA|nr:galactose mutarotase-like [Triticum urartu]XP_048557892.1 galactose mutarotase-like [Triticum urartu]